MNAPYVRFVLVFLLFATATAVVVAQQDLLRHERKALNKGVTIDRTYRGKTCIMFEITKPKTRARCFFVQGKMVATESDEDGDGFFETLTVFGEDRKDFECFVRSTNGTVVPLDPGKLGSLKIKKSTADQALNGLLLGEPE